MRIKVLGSAQANDIHQFAASYVINDTVAIDAGCLGFASLPEQQRIRHVVISHAHMDHLASLPFFFDNILHQVEEPISVYGSRDVIQCLSQYVFNDRVWPDLCRLSEEETPIIRMVEICDGERLELGQVQVTAIELGHVVPTFGFLLNDGLSTVALISDTGPTENIWTECNRLPNLKGVFLESAFPESMRWLAEKAGHLTPEMFHREIQKLDHSVPVVVVHIKPAWYDEVVSELTQLGIPDLSISAGNRVYEF